jgi:hypothetical protein
MNRDKDDFIAVTEVIVVGSKKKMKFLLLHRRAIVWMVPLDEEDSISDFFSESA